MAWDGFLEPSSIEAVAAAVSAVPPAQWCQAFFLFAAAAVLAVAAAPREARTLLVDYGARKADDSPPHPGQKQQATAPRCQAQNRGWTLSLITAVTSWGQVPHSWFGAFYVVSLGCTVFWLVQYLTGGTLMHLIASRQSTAPGLSPTLGQVAVTGAMMLLQVARRIFEHATIVKPSMSTMWVVHWVLGMGFYLFISVSVWVEGSRAILERSVTPSRTFDISSLLKLSVAIPAFLFAWVNQYRCHAHLAGLKKYSVPEEGLFRRLICPHYTCECLLYFSLALAAAPPGQSCNKTLLCALAFVLVNLGVTAAGTRKWYARKFGSAAVAEKWNMIPFLF
ncbi:hypothetical protein B0T25DRAFT_566712 [Lasiosphaeria hispida]|uniref:Polyprenal reductase n=1 Tax=Lasiosphaeria hispida TaxID=260671 RepID=A0AAJ0HM53_9PEZI|nr:hypothetical protein B0T25DRAFT_566712 [Lasiosphaeria hispida]